MCRAGFAKGWPDARVERIIKTKIMRERRLFGAIVAREFGLPAVGGLPGILRQLATGDEVTVDGTQGVVAVVRSASSK